MNSQLWLPGFPVRLVDPFKVRRGQGVYDKKSNTKGKVTRIGEGTAECIEIFVKFEGDSKEYKAYQFRDLVII